MAVFLWVRGVKCDVDEPVISTQWNKASGIITRRDAKKIKFWMIS